ncbi:hypothetical protein DRQ53_13310 [bacterium]|nr:MAG: hypothetical protein DRQ53_13310 [bacterium]
MTPVELELPTEDLYAEFRAGTGAKVPVSTTMAFVRMLRAMLKHDGIGKRIVPIIPDEARTFGMESLFREFRIYAAQGQLYKPVDWDVLLSYSESKDGQILEEGITEAGSMASFTAAGTSYAYANQPMIPFFIFYSMFGFQRVADSIWAFADARGRGFLCGATHGRTTLNGEGLQHQDGHSLLTASTVPNCLAYDPAFHYEIATIVEDGLRRMYDENEDVFYYLALYNENYEMPAMPEGVEEGILRGLYRFSEAKDDQRPRVNLFGSGVILQQVIAAAALLDKDYGVSADVWSVTSYGQLRKDALSAERETRLNPDQPARQSWLDEQLAKVGSDTPVIAVTDSMKAVADQVGRFVQQPWAVLGTDGFGRSDTRENLRRYFEVDAASIAWAALVELSRLDKLPMDQLLQARDALGIDADRPDPASTDVVIPRPKKKARKGAGQKKGAGK